MRWPSRIRSRSLYTVLLLTSATVAHLASTQTEGPLVTVSVIVHDRRGTPVLDLERGHVEVRENGTLQRVESWGAAGAARGPTALVFDTRTDVSGDTADAARRLLASLTTSGVPVGVFEIAHGLDVAEDFTTEVARAHQGLDHVARRARWEYRHIVAGSDGERGSLPSAPVEALRALIADMATHDGRKVMVLFSSGLPSDGDARSPYEQMIAEASGSAVSVYVVNLQAAGRDPSMLNQAVHSTAQAMQDCDAQRVNCGTVDGVGQADRVAADASARGAEQSLTRLARETGGLVMRTQKELTQGVGVLTQHQQSSYVLAYHSNRPVVDGEVRRVEVKVLRSGVRVTPQLHRVAAVASPAATWRSDERAAEDAVASGRSAGDLVHTLDVVQLPGADGTQAAILVAGELGAQEASVRGQSGAFVVARVTNREGDVVATFSERYRLPARVWLERSLDLPPGAYSVESVVHDAHSGRRSVRTHVVDVPAMPHSAVGDLFLVRIVEPLADPDQHAGRPFVSAGLHFSPLAGETVRRSRAAEITAALGLRGVPAGTDLNVELHTEGRTPRRTVVTVTGDDGMHYQVLRLPVAPLPDGIHELRVSGEIDGVAWTRTRTFNLTG